MDLSIAELDELEEGMVIDMAIESGNDMCQDAYSDYILLFIALMYQIYVFSKGKTPYPRWTFVFSMAFGAIGRYFLFGILLSALFQRYVPQDVMTDVFGGNEVWGVLMAATVGVPLYACGGGTIPLLQEWMREGMSMGSGPHQ